MVTSGRTAGYKQFEWFTSSITYLTLQNQSILKMEYVYDALNRITSVTNRKGSTILSSTTQTYDNNGNISAIIEARYGETTTTTYYSYDQLNRLTEIARPNGQTISYTYDTRGNRQAVNEAFNIENVAYEYDLYNKLTKVSRGDQTTTFYYSPDGLRYNKTTNAVAKQYRYNQNQEVIAGINGANQTLAHYVRGDRLLVKKDVVAAKDYYYLYNSHGDVIQIVDTNGEIKNSYKYDEWGNIIDEIEAIDNDFKYTGEIYDEETGLYYLGARYYDPSMGRFINEDVYEGQIDNPLSLNQYTYVHNNPLRYVDPSGNVAVDPLLWSYNYQINEQKIKWAEANEREGDAAKKAASTEADRLRQEFNNKTVNNKELRSGLLLSSDTVVLSLIVLTLTDDKLRCRLTVNKPGC